MNRKKFVYIIWFSLSVLVISGCTKNSNNDRKNPEKVKHLDPYSAPLYPAREITQAKDFEIDLLNGNRFLLTDQIGKVVLINIWATWCTPCLDETPDLVELYEIYQDQGFTLLGVSVDEQGIPVVQAFIDKFDITYPIYIDNNEVISDKYGPYMGIPTTYIIDSKGNLRYFAVGALTRKELEPRIKKLLAEGIEDSS